METDRSARVAGSERWLPLLCLAGAAIALYLSIVHYGLRFGNLSLGDVCGSSGPSDCNSVVASRYGVLLGLPVSVWGLAHAIVAGVLSLAIVLLRREDSAAFAHALRALTAAALVFDAYLGWAQWARLGRFCPFCLASYGIHLLVLAIVSSRLRRWRDRPRWRSLLPSRAALLEPVDPAYYRDVLKALLAGSAVLAVMLVLGVSLSISHAAARAERERLASLLEFVRRTPPVEVPIEGRPARGPADAKITLVVFSDFLCEQCKRASRYVEIVAANHRGTLRVVYRHFPGDSACNPVATASPHPGACRFALAAECAARGGRFWEFHDAVFGDPGPVRPDKLDQYAARAGLDVARLEACASDPSVAEAVAADVALARSLEVGVTPTLFLNGRPIAGALKPWMLEAAIEAVERLPAAGGSGLSPAGRTPR